ASRVCRPRWTSRKGSHSCVRVRMEAAALDPETRVPIGHEVDIVTARQKGRELAAQDGFSRTEQTLIATAISEVARNIVEYAVRGEIALSAIERDGRLGIMVIARDTGPGIPDLELAMRDGYSTGESLGKIGRAHV